MVRRSDDVSSSLIARITGALLLVMAITAGFAALGAQRALVVPGDAATTAAKIAASGKLFRLGFFGYLVAFICDVPVATLLYVLLRPVGKPLALTAMSLRLVYAAVAGASLLCWLGPILLSSGTGYLTVLAPGQLQALALLSLEAFEQGFSLALVFFGVHLVLLGLLLARSSLFPRFLGVLVALAGCAYLTDSVTRVFSPALHATVAPWVALPASFELVLALWLLVKGAQSSEPTSASARRLRSGAKPAA